MDEKTNNYETVDETTLESQEPLTETAEEYFDDTEIVQDSTLAPVDEVYYEEDNAYLEPAVDLGVGGYRFEDVMAETFDLKTLTQDQIPNIDLYMDQVITLFNENIGFSEVGNDKITKAMINNYRKENIISPMKGKRYSRTQIYQILFIYYLKQAMPIADIKTVLNTLEIENYDLEQLYDTFLLDIKKQNEDIKGQIAAAADTIDVTNKEELARLLLQIAGAVSLLSNLSKNIVDKLF